MSTASPARIIRGLCPQCGDLTESDDVCTQCGYVSGSKTGEEDNPIVSNWGATECYGEADRLRARFAALPADADRAAVFAYLAGRCPEYAAEALRLNEPAPQEASR